MALTTPASLHPADVDRRVTAFRAQLDRWRQAGVRGVLLLRLPKAAGTPITAGTCVGCRTPLAAGSTWRCTACTAAVELALGLRPVTSEAGGS